MTGNELREIRLSLGLSQAAFGEKIGRTRVWINRLEAGKEGITLTMERAVRDLVREHKEAAE